MLLEDGRSWDILLIDEKQPLWEFEKSNILPLGPYIPSLMIIRNKIHESWW